MWIAIWDGVHQFSNFATYLCPSSFAEHTIFRKKTFIISQVSWVTSLFPQCQFLLQLRSKQGPDSTRCPLAHKTDCLLLSEPETGRSWSGQLSTQNRTEQIRTDNYVAEYALVGQNAFHWCCTRDRGCTGWDFSDTCGRRGKIQSNRTPARQSRHPWSLQKGRNPSTAYSTPQLRTHFDLHEDQMALQVQQKSLAPEHHNIWFTASIDYINTFWGREGFSKDFPVMHLAQFLGTQVVCWARHTPPLML